jgi:hypothetical protein
MAGLEKILAIFFCLALAGCATEPSNAGPQNAGPSSSGSNDHFPWETKALDAFLVDKSTGEAIDVGRVEEIGGPGHRRAATVECKGLAADEAKKRRIDDWDYYCCTVTDKSDCATKVKELY